MLTGLVTWSHERAHLVPFVTVDPFLLTSECRGQGTVALSSGESELYALGALSAELIFAQAILKEIGLPSSKKSLQLQAYCFGINIKL